VSDLAESRTNKKKLMHEQRKKRVDFIMQLSLDIVIRIAIAAHDEQLLLVHILHELTLHV
jgi:hypothetical protein